MAIDTRSHLWRRPEKVTEPDAKWYVVHNGTGELDY